MASVREELVRWQDCGRVSLDDDGTIHLLAGTSFPGQDEDVPEDEDEPPVSAPKEPPKVPRLPAPSEKKYVHGEPAAMVPNQPGQASLLFPTEEPKAPVTPPVIKDDEPSIPRGEDRSGPPPGWLEAQSEEVRNWYAENLKRLHIIGVPEPEETALLRTWQRFGKSF